MLTPAGWTRVVDLSQDASMLAGGYDCTMRLDANGDLRIVVMGGYK